MLKSFLLTLILLVPSFAKAAPGLLATYTDGKNTIHRVVPTPSFTLAANESAHSQLLPKFNVVYTGLLKITRGGEYTISGDAKVEVKNQVVNDKSIKLTPGEHELKITYSRKAGESRLQLRWRSDFFVDEPMPPDAFEHQPSKNAEFQQWSRIEKGRLLYENLSCASCHGGDGWHLSTRKGPDLSEVGGRVTRDWLATWLKNPRHTRSDSVMPILITEEKDINDVTAYLSTLGESQTKTATTEARVKEGEEIFNRIGCAKCHTEKQHALSGVGAKYASSNDLASFLLDPLHVDPSGRMPQLFDPQTQRNEAQLVAEFLFATKTSKKGWAKAGKGNAVRGRELVQSKGCISCHSLKEEGKPLFNRFTTAPFTLHKGVNSKPVQFHQKKGCLATRHKKGTPDYQLTAEDRANLQAFMKSMIDHPVVARAPVETLYRLSCTE